MPELSPSLASPSSKDSDVVEERASNLATWLVKKSRDPMMCIIVSIITFGVDGHQANGVHWPKDGLVEGIEACLDEGAYVDTDSDEEDLRGRVMCICPSEVALKSD